VNSIHVIVEFTLSKYLILKDLFVIINSIINDLKLLNSSIQ